MADGNKELAGKVALITGAAVNIGRATAVELAKAGAAVAINTRKSADAAKQVVEEIRAAGGQAEAHRRKAARGKQALALLDLEGLHRAGEARPHVGDDDGIVRRAPMVFNVQDVFPDAAVETGAITNQRIIAVARWLERVTYARAAAVTVLSDDLAANVAAKVSPTRRNTVHMIPNFVDTVAIQPADGDGRPVI